MVKKPLPSDTTGSLNSPFARLGELRERLPPGRAAGAGAAAPSRAPAVTKAPARAVVRYERKGHGGKEATRVEQLDLPAASLERWLKEAKQALGCGGSVDGDTLLLQGDQRGRLHAWLVRRGIGKVTLS